MAEGRPLQGRFVVDTNILAYYVLGTEPFNEELDGVFSMPLEMIAPDSWQAEFLNVLWQTIHFQKISLFHGLELLEEVGRLLSWTVPVGSLWLEALAAAEEYNCSTYDTLFVALAEREGCNLLTYDQRLLSRFPTIAKSPSQLLSE
jgi:predicted nucleic acid-binding protein